jgi:hypothetical protein
LAPQTKKDVKSHREPEPTTVRKSVHGTSGRFESCWGDRVLPAARSSGGISQVGIGSSGRFATGAAGFPHRHLDGANRY